MWDPTMGPTSLLELGCYFFSHLLEAACHMPPALSQSTCVVYCEKSPLVTDGLADGEADGPPDASDAPGAALPPPEVPEPEPPPDAPGLPAPEPPGAPLPLPLPDCAPAITGASAMIPTRDATMNFFIVISSIVGPAPTLRFVQLYVAAIFAPPERSTDGRLSRAPPFHPRRVVLSTFLGSAAVTAGRVGHELNPSP